MEWIDKSVDVAAYRRVVNAWIQKRNESILVKLAGLPDTTIDLNAKNVPEWVPTIKRLK